MPSTPRSVPERSPLSHLHFVLHVITQILVTLNSVSACQGSTPRAHTSRSFYFTHGRSATTAVLSPRHCAPIESNDGTFDARIGTLPLPKVSSVLVLLSMARRKSGLARHERSTPRWNARHRCILRRVLNDQQK